MHEFVVKLPRRVIPRWRDFATTASLGELGALRPNPTPEPPKADLAEAKETWATIRTPLAAGDLLMAALVESDWSSLLEAATYLSREDVVAPAFTKEIARHALEWATTERSFPLVSLSATNAPIFNPAVIGIVRRTLAHYPESPIHWVELALGFAIIGKAEKARRAMVTALHLAPDDRFVLRCAMRFFLHSEDFDMADMILARSPRTISDSWLLSAHLAVAAIKEESPKFYKQARNMFAAQSITPFHLSELGSALATDEMTSGNDRRAKKLFKQALVEPTENSLAQALWAKTHIVLEHQNALLELPRSFEANARFLYQAEKWEHALEATQAWQNDEPFSARPAILGSFLAISSQEDFAKGEQIARIGLHANPDDPTLLNNLAFAQASADKANDAMATLGRVPRALLTPEQEIVLMATEGVIQFRSGDPEGGRTKYREAMDVARAKKLPSLLVRAAIHLAREELRCNASTAQEAISEATALASKSNDPGVRLVMGKLERDLAQTPTIVEAEQKLP
jgi:Flp pilus assembly protein TadD